LLPKRLKLTDSNEIKKILKQRQITYSTPLAQIVAKPGATPNPRIVVVCKKKLGSAVIRNRTRRLAQAAFKKIVDLKGKNLDVVVFPRKTEEGLERWEATLSGLINV